MHMILAGAAALAVAAAVAGPAPAMAAPIYHPTISPAVDIQAVAYRGRRAVRHAPVRRYRYARPRAYRSGAYRPAYRYGGGYPYRPAYGNPYYSRGPYIGIGPGGFGVGIGW